MGLGPLFPAGSLIPRPFRIRHRIVIGRLSAKAGLPDANGKQVAQLPMAQTDSHHARPVCEYLDGWSEDTTGIRVS
jgi:hypothetical protein